MYIVIVYYQALSAIHDVQYIVYIHDCTCTCTCTCRCNEVHFFLPSPPSSRAQLARVILRTVVRPVTVTPTWCVRLWPALQCWMTGQTLTGPPSPLETEWLCRLYPFALCLFRSQLFYITMYCTSTTILL